MAVETFRRAAIKPFRGPGGVPRHPRILAPAVLNSIGVCSPCRQAETLDEAAQFLRRMAGGEYGNVGLFRRGIVL
jgi:hypothetical protein